jgi:hypothetical protein
MPVLDHGDTYELDCGEVGRPAPRAVERDNAGHRMPLQMIAEQFDHADTRIAQKHYAHLSQSYVADVIRAASPALGIAS